MSKKIAENDARLIANIAMLEYCGISDVATIRKHLQSKVSGDIKQERNAKIVNNVLNSGLENTSQQVANVMHERVIKRVSEDTEIPLSKANFAGKVGIKWIDFILNPAYRNEVTKKLSTGDFFECMYIRQAAHVANELIQNYDRIKNAYLVSTSK